MRENIFTHKRVLNHIESSPDPESSFHIPLMTIYIKAKTYLEKGDSQSVVSELPEVLAPTYQSRFPTAKKNSKSRRKVDQGSFCESKLMIKQHLDKEHVNGNKMYGIGNNTKVSHGNRSKSDFVEASNEKHLSFPSSFKVKKSGKMSPNSVYYPVTPERVMVSYLNCLVSNGRYYSDERNKPTTPTLQSRKPSYISNGSYKANFFSSKIDKILQRYKSDSTKSSAKKFVL